MQPDPSMPSPRQRDVLELFRARAADRLPPPTYREIGDVLGIASTNGVADHVAALIKKGHLRRVGPEGASRRVQLTARGRRCLVDLLAADVSEALAVLRHGAGDQRPVEGTLRELGQELIATAQVYAAAALRTRRAAQPAACCVLCDQPILDPAAAVVGRASGPHGVILHDDEPAHAACLEYARGTSPAAVQ